MIKRTKFFPVSWRQETGPADAFNAKAAQVEGDGYEIEHFKITGNSTGLLMASKLESGLAVPQAPPEPEEDPAAMVEDKKEKKKGRRQKSSADEIKEGGI